MAGTVKLYSVVRSEYPYKSGLLIAHREESAAAKRVMDSAHTGIVSMFPSSDLPDTVSVGDVLAAEVYQ